MIKAKRIYILFLCSVFFILMLSCANREQKEAKGTTVLKDELKVKLDDYLNRFTAYGFAGTIFVAKEGEIILNKGYGLADKKRDIPCTAETVYDIGSITKQFTAAAIMKLEAEGKLSTSDPITKYFENVPGDKTGITIHHLLTHTAGLLHSYGGDYEVAPRDETVKLMFDTPLKFKPGEKWSYSNGGFSILGAIVEKLTGQSYDAYLNETFFKPLGMNSTGYTIPELDEDKVVKYQNEELPIDFESPLDRPGPYWHLYTNGGILSTTGDMYKWHLALKGDAILPEEQKKKLFAPHVKTTRGEMFYAYGWLVRKTNRETTSIEHGGGSHEGVNCRFLRYIDENGVIIILSHVYVDYMGAGSWAVDNIEKIVFGGDYKILPEFIEIDPTILQKYTGTYEFSSGAKLTVSIENVRLKFTAQNREAIILLTFPDGEDLLEQFKQINISKCIFMPKTENEFVSFNIRNSKPRHVRFNITATGDVTGLTYQTDKGDLVAKKVE